MQEFHNECINFIVDLSIYSSILQVLSSLSYEEGLGGEWQLAIVSNMTEISPKIALVEVEGDIDFSISQKFKEELIGLVNGGKSKLIIDLGKVRYIDSSGLEALTSTQSKARFHQGDVYLICADMNIRKIFDITGLDEYIKIFDTREKALEQVGEK